MFNSSVNNKRHRTLQERLGGQASSIHRTNAVQISVPSRNNRDTTTMNSNNINNILVEQLKQDNANLSNRLANCEQQIGQLTSQLQIVCNTLEQLQQEPASSSVLTKHSIDHRKDIKAIGVNLVYIYQ
ncbi:uncharacterized protein BX663DRAFT_528115 [Cokeromyces recurvatus]|uniref:uncharacterized protein n=1 Tax=Cokeromyces recurvatus TaxID=90255 RepID=UPI0022211DD2|nr:uncharacterized protein BX663DRAFT_528115 [Cokeromyces recurvatus]KAI7897479.1 hypothetical protein BX663DRAFT_528115 [Cokeromyces recurvatus]